MAASRGSSAGKPSGKGKPSPKGKPLSSGAKISKSGGKSKVKRPPPTEVKSKSRSAPEQQKKTKKRQYTEKELDLPTLNMITPVGVQQPRGKKKGKTFVDDQVRFHHVLISSFAHFD
jgi:60S ribosomal subunit assembly/export protein LOC1